MRSDVLYDEGDIILKEVKNVHRGGGWRRERRRCEDCCALSTTRW